MRRALATLFGIVATIGLACLVFLNGFIIAHGVYELLTGQS